MRAYKVFNSDWTCNNFQYKIGERYVMQELPILCKKGFHACIKLIDCFNYYKFDSKNKVAIVEIHGDIVGEYNDKISTNDIEIIRELNWYEVLLLVNSGSGNSGYKNSGSGNSGYGNSGSGNSGDGNSGDGNSGYRNSGDKNSGDKNSGSGNSGYRNSGDGNSGHGNSGYWNSCDYESGFFNSKNKKTIRIFNSEINITRNELFANESITLCNKFYIRRYRNKNKEIISHTYKYSWSIWWAELSKDERKKILSIPNFDTNIFFDITGIDIKKYAYLRKILKEVI